MQFYEAKIIITVYLYIFPIHIHVELKQENVSKSTGHD